jgi:molecular chaperone GrpE
MPEQQDTAATPETAAAAPTTPSATPDVMPSLEESLRKVELQAAEHYDAWLRAKADAENIRKRAQDDIAKAHKFAIESFASELIAVRDSLEAALSAASEMPDAVKTGVELTLRQLTSVFERFAVREVNPVGEKFDPHRHQAMTTVPSDAPPNTVVQVFQKGYLLHDRVLRPALVSVAKAGES